MELTGIKITNNFYLLFYHFTLYPTMVFISTFSFVPICKSFNHLF